MLLYERNMLLQTRRMQINVHLHAPLPAIAGAMKAEPASMGDPVGPKPAIPVSLGWFKMHFFTLHFLIIFSLQFSVT
ncbi:hypothetical protein A4D02_09600 [Niastella koreensis]|uniref:Uncharacterized protein n=2 Tax=Niastella koreensis TaxID=354356 RepID=G8TN89_NIAKG|nr:hypothetical protein [Niastella koreensis]AEV98791.1 hypothetical protein Niako_2449 [Niastella koreensis GR20-10]OQP43727.1 hypothetical protein A4D02_09600 [Niastella koreensis]